MIFAQKSNVTDRKQRIHASIGATVEKQWHKPGRLAKSMGIHILKFRYWLQKSEGCQAKGSPFIELTNPAIQNINIRYPNGVEISLPSVTSIGLIKSLIDL